ncbi:MULTISPECIES: hypothetical protein [Actinoalloteichus]|uniref:PPE family domain-containing protein n=1 Tax=Actinoalloteichus fjordicus TaxID=1612552 RepID=A0AAC9LHI1_9PSEU|nr:MULTISPECIES: hypothetical protein [Actinoalloteichus]APU17010.1 hypothetical protein UA74_24980 [Actinoalloteichus fjordicus]APU23090.1 hypothetical protein UA75_25560 [Actinoalloteichus sp. GBA129-24]
MSGERVSFSEGMPINHHRYEGYSLAQKYQWMQEDVGPQAAGEVNATLRRMAERVQDSDANLRAAFRSVGSEWQGSAADNLAAAGAAAAVWSGDSGVEQQLSGRQVEATGDGFASTRHRIQPAKELGDYGIGDAFLDIYGGPFGVESDLTGTLAENRARDAEANRALYEYESQFRDAHRGMAVLGEPPVIAAQQVSASILSSPSQDVSLPSGGGSLSGPPGTGPSSYSPQPPDYQSPPSGIGGGSGSGGGGGGQPISPGPHRPTPAPPIRDAGHGGGDPRPPEQPRSPLKPAPPGPIGPGPLPPLPGPPGDGRTGGPGSRGAGGRGDAGLSGAGSSGSGGSSGAQGGSTGRLSGAGPGVRGLPGGTFGGAPGSGGLAGSSGAPGGVTGIGGVPGSAGTAATAGRAPLSGQPGLAGGVGPGGQAGSGEEDVEHTDRYAAPSNEIFGLDDLPKVAPAVFGEDPPR